LTPRQALDFIRYHGVILQAARGLEPTLTDRIVGEPVSGSWWSHPKSHDIFSVIQHVHASRAILVCVLAGGKVTFVHRRLWPHFVRIANKFPVHALDKVQQLHLPSGRHQRQTVPFPDWVPEDALDSAKRISVARATAELQVWVRRYGAS
jgi:hypothetical protein